MQISITLALFKQPEIITLANLLMAFFRFNSRERLSSPKKKQTIRIADFLLETNLISLF